MTQRPTPESCLTIDDIHVGQTFRQPYEITDTDVQAFAQLSGDYNPAHFDEAYAKTTIFRKRIAHGMISVAKFSGVFGMHLPGLGAIWASQSVTFLAPVYLNTPYTACVACTTKDDRTATFSTWVENAEGKKVLEGEGVLYPIPAKVKNKVSPELLPA